MAMDFEEAMVALEACLKDLHKAAAALRKAIDHEKAIKDKKEGPGEDLPGLLSS